MVNFTFILYSGKAGSPHSSVEKHLLTTRSKWPNLTSWLPCSMAQTWRAYWGRTVTDTWEQFDQMPFVLHKRPAGVEPRLAGHNSSLYPLSHGSVSSDTTYNNTVKMLTFWFFCSTGLYFWKLLHIWSGPPTDLPYQNLWGLPLQDFLQVVCSSANKRRQCVLNAMMPTLCNETHAGENARLVVKCLEEQQS